MKTFNPLHEYRDYTPHYALLAAKHTGVWMPFFQADDKKSADDLMKKYSHPSGGYETRYSTQELYGTEYVVIFNSTTDAEFYIDKLTLTSIIQSQNSHMKAGTTINSAGVNMEMKIIEPYTVDFISSFQMAAQNLGIDSLIDLSFLLKIYFIGYKDDDNVDIISYVSPITFQISQVVMALTEAGAEYTIKCIPDNNFGNIPKFNTIGAATLPLSTNLKEAIENLNIYLSQQDDTAYADTKDTNHKYVAHRVCLDPDYEDPRYKLNNVSSDNSNQYMGIHEKTPIQFVAGKTDKVATAIQSIMSMCTAVSEDLVAGQSVTGGAKLDIGDGSGKSSTFKISSYRHVAENGDETIYHYIFKQVIATNAGVAGGNSEVDVLNDSDIAKGNSEASRVIADALNTDKNNPINKPVLKVQDYVKKIEEDAIENAGYMEFDYIYTGKNVDILLFQMVIPWASAAAPFALYLPTSANTSSEQLEKVSNQQDPKKAAQNKKTAQNEITEIAVYNANSGQVSTRTSMGPLIVDPSGVATGAASSVDFYRCRMALSKYISQTQPAAALEIFGNPLLLNNMIQVPSTFFDIQAQPHPMSKVMDNLKERNKQGGIAGFTKYMPVVKINVRAPKPIRLQGGVYNSGVDIDGTPVDVDYENKFSTKFWNDGLFAVAEIDHVFDRNKFTQKMKLIYQSNDDGTIDKYQTGPRLKPDSVTGSYPKLSSKKSTADINAARQRIYNKLHDLGFSTIHAAGIIGVMQRESGFDSNIHENTGHGGGYGLLQWDNDPKTGLGRKKDLLDEAARLGVSASDEDFQLNFMMKELNGSESAAYRKLLATGTPEDAAAMFTMHYERPWGVGYNRTTKTRYWQTDNARAMSSLALEERMRNARDAYTVVMK